MGVKKGRKKKGGEGAGIKKYWGGSLGPAFLGRIQGKKEGVLISQGASSRQEMRKGPPSTGESEGGGRPAVRGMIVAEGMGHGGKKFFRM